MPRYKKYIDVDVVTEAKNRIRHVFDIFDTIVVMFSGGKDSLVTLHLVWEIAQERGHDHINVVFRDEELIPDEVIDFVDEYRRKPWIKMLWFAVPLRSHKFVLGVTKDYIQWDNDRKWVREKPEWAITLPEGDKRVFDQYTMDTFTASFYKGKIAFITGIRSSESLVRYRACVNKLNENYITTPTTYGKQKPPANVKLVKPIYDWEEDDIFKWFGEEGVPYCSVYDAQLWAGLNMRVSTPIHAEAAKKFHKLREHAPTLYAQVIDIFPEMILQERYYGELDKQAVKDRYGKDLNTVKEWIDNHLEGGERELATKRLQSVRVRARKHPTKYPPEYVLNAMMTGAFKREILPKGK